MSPQISPLIRVEVGATTDLTFKLKVGGADGNDHRVGGAANPG